MTEEKRKPKTSKSLTLRFRDPVDQRLVWGAASLHGVCLVNGTEADIEAMFLTWCRQEIEADRAKREG